VLAAGIRVVTKDEGSKHRPVDGPGPGERGLHADLERDEDRKQQGEASHRRSFLVAKVENNKSLAGGPDVVKQGYSDAL
jgi:hypothetical protein